MFGVYSNPSRKDLPSNSFAPASNSRKKIKDYSYGYMDQIGKGFSSVVYKGTNDVTSKQFLGMGVLMLSYLCVCSYFR